MWEWVEVSYVAGDDNASFSLDGSSDHMAVLGVIGQPW